MIMLNVTKKEQSFTLFLENTFLEKTQGWVKLTSIFRAKRVHARKLNIPARAYSMDNKQVDVLTI